MNRFGRLSTIAAALTIGGACAVAPATAAQPAIRFEVSTGSPCFIVLGPSDTKGIVTVRTPGGRIRGQVDVRTDSAGRASDCIYTLLPGIATGDSIGFRNADVDVTWSIPELAVAVDRVTDEYTISADPGRTVQVTGYRGAYTGIGRVLFGADRVLVDDGLVVVDPGVDMLGADRVMAMLRARGNTLYAQAYAPFIVIQVASPYVSGAVRAGDSVVVRLSRQGVTRAVHHTEELLLGQFLVFLRDADGDTVYPRPGDVLTVSATRKMSMRIPRAGLSGDPVSETISGRCFADAAYLVSASAPFPSSRGFGVTLRGTTGSDGTFVRHLSDGEDMHKGDELQLTCSAPSGDVIQQRRVIPR